MRYFTSRLAAATIALVLALCTAIGAEQASRAQWVTAWSTSQQALGDTTLSDTTVRLMARVTASGDAVRIRLDNTFGTQALVVGAATVGEPMLGARLSQGSVREVRFDGARGVTVPAGGSAQSDPVTLKVLAFQDLAVSLHIPEADVRPSQHTGARVTSFFAANGAGDRTADESAEAFARVTTSMFWLKSIDVLSDTSTGTVVAFGDSITDGSCATVDGYDRWEDWLAVRFHLDAPTGHPAVINEGIGGNTISGDYQPPPTSTPGLERLERDVLAHSAVTHVILFMGTNDLRRGSSPDRVIAGMEEIIERVHAAGLRIIGATVIPRHNRAPTATNSGWNPSKTAARRVVNDWIRQDAPFDGVLDFDEVVRSPTNPDLIHPPFDCDGVHPNRRGYYAVGGAVPLEMFRE